jgi:uncharacterized membrane protein HdeD (DUF308 family)
MALVVGGLLIAIGVVWLFQGYGALKGSFMTGSPMWMWIGIACLIAGVMLVVRELRSRRGAGRSKRS